MKKLLKNIVALTLVLTMVMTSQAFSVFANSQNNDVEICEMAEENSDVAIEEVEEKKQLEIVVDDDLLEVNDENNLDEELEEVEEELEEEVVTPEVEEPEEEVVTPEAEEPEEDEVELKEEPEEEVVECIVENIEVSEIGNIEIEEEVNIMDVNTDAEKEEVEDVLILDVEEDKENIVIEEDKDLVVAKGADYSNGLNVRVAFQWLDFTSGENEQTFDLNALGLADAGTVTLKKKNGGIVNEVIFKDVKITTCPEPAGVTLKEDVNQGEENWEDPGIIFINAKQADTYTVTFDGNNSIMYSTDPSEDLFTTAVVGAFWYGSVVKVNGINGGKLNANGINFQEYQTGGEAAITNMYFDNMTFNTNTYEEPAFMVYSTKTHFNNSNLNVKCGAEGTHCLIIGIGNEQFTDPEFTTEFVNCTVKAENDSTNSTHVDLGYPSPSAFNCSHTEVLFKNCEVTLKVPHVPLGECRGVYMLSGGITVEGGKMDIVCGDDPIDDLANLEFSAGIQAVNVKFQNAEVNITSLVDVEKRRGAEHTCSTWGIIYAYNVIINRSKVVINADGSNSQGIYYFGSSKERNGFKEGISKMGNVQIVDSSVDINAVGESEGYTCVGISGRNIEFSLPENSEKIIKIHAIEKLYGLYNYTVVAYDFHSDGSINFTNGAYMSNLPNGCKGKIYNSDLYATDFYTIFENTKKKVDEKPVTDLVIAAHKSSQSGGGSSGRGSSGGSSGGSGGGSGSGSGSSGGGTAALDFGMTQEQVQVPAAAQPNLYINKKLSVVNAWEYDPVTGDWYRANANGNAMIYWFQDTNGKWYFLDVNSGKMSKGLQVVNEKVYYFAETTGNGKEVGDLYINEMTPYGMADANGQIKSEFWPQYN